MTGVQTCALPIYHNLRRNIKKARNNRVAVTGHGSVEDIITLFRENRGREVSTVSDNHYKRFTRLCHDYFHRGRALFQAVYNQQNVMVAGAVFLRHQNRLVFIFSGLSEEGKQLGAMPLIIDDMISRNAQSNLIIDFEGSNDPGLARFYQSFGAEKETYWFYQRKAWWLFF